MESSDESFSEQDNILIKSIFDQHSEYGYLTIETFIMIIKENWPFNLDNLKLELLVNYVDSMKQGQINYTQFLNGIRRMTKLSETNDINDSHGHNNIDSDSGVSLSEPINETFNEYNHLNVNKDENFEDFGEKNDTSESSFDSLLNTHSLLRIPSLKSNLLNSRKKASEQRYETTSPNGSNTHSSYLDDHLSFANDNDTQILSLENKIRDLETHVEHLKSENSSIKEKYAKIQMDNLNLNEKIHMLEENKYEVERHHNFMIDNEKIKLNEQIVKLNTKFNDEKDGLLIKIQKAELEIKSIKDEQSKLVKQLVEINRSLDLKILNEVQLNEKLSNLNNDYQRLQRERDMYRDENESLKHNYNQRLDMFTNENTLLKAQVQELKVRETNIQQEDSLKIKDLEFELRSIKSECKLLQARVQELDAQLLKSSLDAGRQLLLTQTQVVPSLAAEMETLSKDDLLAKLNREQSATARYREYIEGILQRIMEVSPEILEVKQLPKENVKLTKSTSVKFSKY